MNRINELFEKKSGNVLSIYFTAGYPTINSTIEILKTLVSAGTDMIEIGVPFSDPLADGPVIQKSNLSALKNGMNLKLLFSQLQNIRREINIPLLIMSYINPILQFGMEEFCGKCEKTGIDGVILPDLPPEVYMEEYSALFQSHHLNNILLISPQTTAERIREIDKLSTGFVYVVSSSSTTGVKNGFSKEQLEYFLRVRNMKLHNPGLIGFGISDHETYELACKYSNGAIIGSTFIKMLDNDPGRIDRIRDFISSIRT